MKLKGSNKNKIYSGLLAVMLFLSLFSQVVSEKAFAQSSDDWPTQCFTSTVPENTMFGHLENQIDIGGNTEQIFYKSDLFLAENKRNDKDNIFHASIVLDCINEFSKLDISEDIASFYSKTIRTDNYDNLAPIVRSYQKTYGLDINGKVDASTALQMGLQIGEILELYEGYDGPDCTDLELDKLNSEYLDIGLDDQHSTDKNTMVDLLKCVAGETTIDKPFEFMSTGKLDANDLPIKSFTINGQKAGLTLLYTLGIHAGAGGAKMNSSYVPGGSFDTADWSNCMSIKFGQNDHANLYLSEGSDNDSLNVSALSKILLCINGDENRNFLDINGVTLDPNATNYASVKPGVEVFQSFYANMADDFPNIIPPGTLEVSTAFRLGVEMGKIERRKNPTLYTSVCKNENISFSPTHSISYTNKGISQNTNPLYENTSNNDPLQSVFNCLKLIPTYSQNLNPQNYPFPEIIANPAFQAFTHADNPEMYENKNDYSPTLRIGVGALYELGKIVGEYGGYSLAGQDATSSNDIDYCSNSTVSELGEKAKLYSSKNIQFIPRNPGVIDWFSVSENNSTEECLTKTELAASIVGRVIRFFEAFVAIIAVLMFIYGGFLYVTAHGDESQSQKALKTLYVGVGGIFIIIMSRFITEILIPLNEDGISIDQSKAFSNETLVNQQIASIANWLLGFSSLITVSMLVYGGYLWLVSGGDEGMETKAKDVLRTALIGFVVIFSAYTITMVVLGGAGITN